MKAPKSPQQVFKTLVIIIIISVIVLTAAAGLTSYLIASGQEKQSQSVEITFESTDTVPMYRTSSLILVQNGSTSNSGIVSGGEDVKTNEISSSVELVNTVAMLLSIMLTAAIYSSQKKKVAKVVHEFAAHNEVSSIPSTSPPYPY